MMCAEDDLDENVTDGERDDEDKPDREKTEDDIDDMAKADNDLWMGEGMTEMMGGDDGDKTADNKPGMGEEMTEMGAGDDDDKKDEPMGREEMKRDDEMGKECKDDEGGSMSSSERGMGITRKRADKRLWSEIGDKGEGQMPGGWAPSLKKIIERKNKGSRY